MVNHKGLLLLGLAILTCIFVGCDETSGERPTCDELGEFCHEATSKEGIACHEFVEADEVTEDECLDKLDECKAVCSD